MDKTDCPCHEMAIFAHNSAVMRESLHFVGLGLAVMRENLHITISNGPADHPSARKRRVLAANSQGEDASLHVLTVRRLPSRRVGAAALRAMAMVAVSGANTAHAGRLTSHGDTTHFR